MNFLKFYKNQYKINEAEAEAELSNEEKEQIEIEQSLEILSEKAFKLFKEKFSKNADVILTKIRKEGIEIVFSQFINNVFLKDISDEEKVFITLNFDMFLQFLIDEFVKFSKNAVKSQQDKEEKEEK